jgi:hemolysin activation/secretion protein
LISQALSRLFSNNACTTGTSGLQQLMNFWVCVPENQLIRLFSNELMPHSFDQIVSKLIGRTITKEIAEKAEQSGGTTLVESNLLYMRQQSYWFIFSVWSLMLGHHMFQCVLPVAADPITTNYLTNYLDSSAKVSVNPSIESLTDESLTEISEAGTAAVTENSLSSQVIFQGVSVAQATGSNLPTNAPANLPAPPLPANHRAPFLRNNSENYPQIPKRQLELNNIPQLPRPTRGINDSRPLTKSEAMILRIDVVGSTVFSAAELNQITANYTGRWLTLEQMLMVRSAITNLYIQRGFTTSGAFLPVQDLSNGVLQIQVIEGSLERIDIKGLTNLQEEYIRERIGLYSQTPINIHRLESGLQLLQQDPIVAGVQAELKSGNAPGKNVLSLNLTMAEPWRTEIGLENRDSPSVGALRGSFSITNQNLTGWGDRATVNLAMTEGIRSYSVEYERPINAMQGTIGIRYAQDTSRIVEYPFNAIDIRGATQTLGVNYRQPLSRSPNGEFALGLGFDVRSSQTYILDNVPFSFSVGPEQGYSQVVVMRFSQDWVNRSASQVLAMRSQVSLGLGGLGATVNNSGTDGRFATWLGQVQFVQALGGGSLFLTRMAAQLSSSSLLPLEQFSMGGIDTVRGYRQNRVVGDNGILASVEGRFPIWRGNLNGDGALQITPFFDFGKMWNNRSVINSPDMIASLGLGFRYQFNRHLAFRLEYGFPLVTTNQTGRALEDNGLFFSVRGQW